MSSYSSYWLNFFREAGLPEKIGTKYAVLFASERVDASMLGEFTKDILKDMGVTAMGDIITILRHARETLDKDYEEKTLEGIKCSTPAGRMIAHYSGKNSERTNRALEKLPPRKKVMLDTSQAAARPTRPVVPDAGINYKVVLPKGTTPKTRAILEQMKKNKNTQPHSSMEADKVDDHGGSVFSRLYGQGTPRNSQPKQQQQQSSSVKCDASVFNRLGPRTADHTDPDSSSASEYQGVLKLTAGGKRKINESSSVATPSYRYSPAKRLRLQGNTTQVVQAEATSTTHSEGIFASRRPGTQNSVYTRLGDAKERTGVTSRLGIGKTTNQPFRVTGSAPVLTGPRQPRRVTPEMEGRYRIVMPQGTTPKTRAILQKLREAKGDGTRGSKTSRKQIVWDL